MYLTFTLAVQPLPFSATGTWYYHHTHQSVTLWFEVNYGKTTCIQQHEHLNRQAPLMDSLAHIVNSPFLCILIILFFIPVSVQDDLYH